jgi:hypothetical protein
MGAVFGTTSFIHHSQWSQSLRGELQNEDETEETSTIRDMKWLLLDVIAVLINQTVVSCC